MTERWRDGGTKRQRDRERESERARERERERTGETVIFSVSRSPALPLFVSLSLCLSISVSPSLRCDSLRAGSQTRAHLFLIPPRGRFDSLFVERQQPPVAHQQAAVNYGAAGVRRLRGVHQMRNDIIHRRQVKGAQIDNDQVSPFPRLDRADLALHVQRARAAD